ncbi:MAG: Rpn family recombination-promoting nuclease/putative transposase [Syntrophomonadaceae bacterium]|nr:Rpn family recombination-promoting nuclease/putative transposase [Syntrophomonadaceae bacterium]
MPEGGRYLPGIHHRSGYKGLRLSKKPAPFNQCRLYQDNNRKFTPNYEYLLYDLSRYADDEIKGEAQLRILFTTFRDIFTKDSKGLQDSIFRAISYLRELDDKQTGIEYFETLMRYIFNARADLTRADFKAVVNKIETTYPEGSEVVMTLAEIFREEGMEKG